MSKDIETDVSERRKGIKRTSMRLNVRLKCICIVMYRDRPWPGFWAGFPKIYKEVIKSTEILG